MPIICDWYHHDCLLSCCSIFKVLCVSFTEVNSFIISHCFQLVKHFFSKFFNFFLKPKFQLKLLVFGLLMSFLSSRVSLSRWQLIYNIMPKLICQHLFWKKSRFFSKKWETPTFSLNYAGFRAFQTLFDSEYSFLKAK